MTLILAFFLTWMHAVHPIHVCVTNMEVDGSNREILITHKLYIEDFTLLFYHLYEKNIRFVEGQDLSQKESGLISEYMDTAFFLEIGNKKLPITFTGKEQDDESIWMHYTCKLPEENLSGLALTNYLLLALFEDQTNLVIVSAGFSQKGYTFTANKWKHDIGEGLQ